MKNSNVVFGANKTYCCVPQCSSGAWKDKNLSFHKFPLASQKLPKFVQERQFRRRKKWTLALRIGKPVTNSMVVCSKHFQKSDYFTHRQGEFSVCVNW